MSQVQGAEIRLHEDVPAAAHSGLIVEVQLLSGFCSLCVALSVFLVYSVYFFRKHYEIKLFHEEKVIWK